MMIQIPKKRCSSDQQLIKPLMNWIGEQNLEHDFSVAIADLDSKRTDIRNHADNNETVLPIYYRYYSLLCSLEKRVPFEDLSIKFYWYDVFTETKVGCTSIHYEKACVLFNIASIHSSLGAKLDCSTNDGIKAAAKNFCIAAGTYDTIKSIFEKHPGAASSDDFASDCLSMLVNLMLAQSQELFYNLAMKTNMQPGPVSKLAAQAAEYYNSAFEIMSRENIKKLCFTGYYNEHKNWPILTEAKREFMNGVAHYQLAKEIRGQHRYGEELGRYKSSLSHLESITQEKKDKIQPIAWFEDYHKKVQSTYSNAKKENDLIYHQTPQQNLTPLVKKSMVQLLQIPEDKLKMVGPDPFINLIPQVIKKGVEMWNEKKNKLIDVVTKEVAEYSKTTKDILNSLGLPDALDGVESPNTVPKPLLKKMEAVKVFGGLPMIMEKLEALSKLAQENTRILERSIKLLEDEDKDDKQLRSDYGTKWNRVPSTVLTRDLLNESHSLSKDIAHARTSDVYIVSLVEQNATGIENFRKTESEILSQIPSTQVKNTNSTKALRECLKNLDQMLLTRETLFATFKSKINAHSVIDKLCLVNESRFENVINGEIAIFDKDVQDIRNTFTLHEPTFQKIQIEYTQFVKEQNQQNELAQRQKVMQEFDIYFTNFQQIKEHLSEAFQFHSNFQELVSKFEAKCSDQVLARNTEKIDLINDILDKQQSNQDQEQAMLIQQQLQTKPLSTQQTIYSPTPIIQSQQYQQLQYQQSQQFSPHISIIPQQPQLQPQIHSQFQPHFQSQYSQQHQFQVSPPVLQSQINPIIQPQFIQSHQQPQLNTQLQKQQQLLAQQEIKLKEQQQQLAQQQLAQQEMKLKEQQMMLQQQQLQFQKQQQQQQQQQLPQYQHITQLKSQPPQQQQQQQNLQLPQYQPVVPIIQPHTQIPPPYGFIPSGNQPKPSLFGADPFGNVK